MENNLKSCDENKTDWVANKRNLSIAWILPGITIFLSWLTDLSSITTALIWASALSWMGFACLRNAQQCGRRHCFYSGPYFLISALFALAIGFDWEPFTAVTFNQLALYLAIATPLICFLPDMLWGKYKG